MRGLRLVTSALALGGLVLVGGAGTAGAIFIPSFFQGAGAVPEGSLITNLVFTNTGGDSYNGTDEQFDITMNMTGVQFTDGDVPGSVAITPGNVVLNLQATLSGSVSGTNPVEGDYAGGFGIVDVAGGSVPLLTATFTGSGTHLSMVNFGGGTLTGSYTSFEPVNNLFFEAMGSDGLLSLSLAGTPIFPSSILDGGGGLDPFTFTPTGAMLPDAPMPVVHTPEPSAGLLVGLGIAGLAIAGRKRGR